MAYCLKMLLSGKGKSGTSAGALWCMWLATISAWMVVPPTDDPATMVGVRPLSTVMSPAMLAALPNLVSPMVTGGLAAEEERTLAWEAGAPPMGFLVSMTS